MELLWSPVIKTSKDGDRFYGLGWAMQDEKSGYAFGEKHRFYAAHTGGAVGASSVLLIYPRTSEEKSFENTQNTTTEKSYEK